MMKLAQTLAQAEVERHIAAGHLVYLGRRDGKPVFAGCKPGVTDDPPRSLCYLFKQMVRGTLKR